MTSDSIKEFKDRPVPQVPWHQEKILAIDNSEEKKIIDVHNAVYLELMKVDKKGRERILRAVSILYGVSSDITY